MNVARFTTRHYRVPREVWWGERRCLQGRRRQHLLGLSIAILLGLAFVAVQLSVATAHAREGWLSRGEVQIVGRAC